MMKSANFNSSYEKVLQRMAIDIMVQNGWLVRLLISLDQPKKPDRLMVFAFPNSTISDIKTIVQQQLEVPEKEQVLTMSDRPLFTGLFHDNVKAIYGSKLANTKMHRRFRLHLQAVPMNPRLESLLNLVGLDDWKERDAVVAQTMRQDHLWNVEKECPKGHSLCHLPVQPQLRERGGSNTEFRCMICDSTAYLLGRTDRTYDRCEYCWQSYCICGKCRKQVKRKASTKNKSTHELLEYLACSLGFRAAVFSLQGNYFKSHDKYLRRFMEIPMKLYESTNSLIILPGARLKIRLPDRIRATIQRADNWNEVLQALEVDRICDNGATLGELQKIKKFWEERSPDGMLKTVWPSLEESERDYWWEPWDGWFVGIETTLMVLSYSLEEVTVLIRFRALFHDDGDY